MVLPFLNISGDAQDDPFVDGITETLTERFDKQSADLLDMQDEVTARLARSIHMELVAAESRRAAREHPDRLDSVDHTLRGWAAWNRHLSLEAARQARGFFEAALRLDENNVDALPRSVPSPGVSRPNSPSRSSAPKR